MVKILIYVAVYTLLFRLIYKVELHDLYGNELHEQEACPDPCDGRHR